MKTPARERLDQLIELSRNPENVEGQPYADFILFSEDAADNPRPDYVSGVPSVPQLLGVSQHAFLPLIRRLPDGRHVFYGRLPAQELIEHLNNPHFAACYVARDWQELWDTRHPMCPHIFEAEVIRPQGPGGSKWVRCLLQGVQLGDELQGIHSPHQYFGDPNLEVDLTTQPFRRFRVTHPSEEELAEFHKSEWFFFLVDHFGIDLQEKSHLKVTPDVHWWPAVTFPLRAELSSVLETKPDSPWSFPERSFTGVLAVRKTSTDDLAANHQAYKKVRAQGNRLRCLLHSLHQINFSFRAFGHSFLVEDPAPYTGGPPKMVMRYTAIEIHEPYQLVLMKRNVQRFQLSEEEFRALLNLAFEDVPFKKKSPPLKYFLQRSLDSVDLARTVSERSLGYVLLTAGVEALVSAQPQEGITASLALAMAGLMREWIPAPETHKLFKAAYNARSDIVHSFQVPDDADLQHHAALMEWWYIHLLKRVYEDHILTGVGSRDQLLQKLQAEALESTPQVQGER